MSFRTATRIALSLAVALLISANANALLFRAYLAPGPAGNDANNCTLAAPCRLLPAALAAVQDGGEIWMLDSANYNTATVVIGKSVSILAVPGAVGSVVATGGPAISIAASNLDIALRNLVIVPLPASGATDGIVVTGASLLSLEDSLIANLTNGIHVNGTGLARITNTTFRNSKWGVSAENGAQVTIGGSKLLGNISAGIFVKNTAPVTTTVIVSDSLISGNGAGSNGVSAQNYVGGAAEIFLTRCTIERFDTGLLAFSNHANAYSTITVSYSMITKNNFAWSNFGADSTIKTLGNNHIQDNPGANTGSLTAVGLQ